MLGLYLFVPIALSANNYNFKIKYMFVSEGLSQNEVTSITSDKYGFMWFGTRGGLNRYDGYKFKQFKPIVNDSNSLQNPSIERLYKDVDGNLLIGTKSGGFSIYDLSNEEFHHLDDSLKNEPNRVISFYEDQKRNLWIGQWTGGITLFNRQTGRQEVYLHNNRVNTITQTNNETIWCGTNDGLFYKTKKGDFVRAELPNKNSEVTRIVKDPEGPYLWLVGWDINLIRYNYEQHSCKTFYLPRSMQSKAVKTYSLMHDEQQRLWIGTWGNGLYLFNKKQETFQRIKVKPEDSNRATVDFEVILDIYNDGKGNIWLGTDGGGVVQLSRKSRFTSISAVFNNELYRRHVNDVLADSQGHIWIGTKEEGLFVTKDKRNYTRVDFAPEHALTKSINIRRISEDLNGNIWVNINQGLYIVRKKGERLQLVPAATYFNSSDLNLVSKAHAMLHDDKYLWVATQDDGLLMYEYNSQKYVLRRHFGSHTEASPFNTNRISTLIKDLKNRLWVGTYKGLYLYDAGANTFNAFNDLTNAYAVNSCDIILSTYVDAQNNIWFGTPCNLHKASEKTDGKFKVELFNQNNGLSDDYISSIIGDYDGHIWISTNNGLSRIDAHDGSINNYDEADGIGGNNYSESACSLGPDSTIYFGGYSDLTFFKPAAIADNVVKPELVFTSFKVLNKEVPINPKGILKKGINEVDKIVLSHGQNEFSFEFSALAFKAPHRNRYAYWLEGFEKSWNDIGRRRHVSFNNLKSGKYKLHVKGTNSNGFWNQKGKSIEIVIKSPPWRTWYAICIYIFLIVLIVFYINRTGQRQAHLEGKARMERMLREKETQMNESKLRFFTDISHEIRTPLTLILAPLNELLKKDISALQTSALVKRLKLIHHNTSRLYYLVNRLLEFRKMEAGKLKLEANEQNIIPLIDNIIIGFNGMATINSVDFKVAMPQTPLMSFVDTEKFQIVIYNLLANAFKYAGKPAKVNLKVLNKVDDIVISVSNNGKGIAQNELAHLFDRFYQARGNEMGSGTGIGLALVKTYVEMHNGEVNVQSTPNINTEFTLTFKKGHAHLPPDALVTPLGQTEELILPLPKDTALPTGKSNNTGTKGASILVVEDNDDVRNYLVELLGEQYEVMWACHGFDGYEKTLQAKPDLVLSDVMMPQMDGFELCDKIKSNELVSYIPVMLLTAKGTSNDQLYGTRKGADVYLTKPFDPDLLLEKVKQLLASRSVLSKKYKQNIKLESFNIELSNEDGQLMKKICSTIEKNLSNADFDPDLLAHSQAMSTSTLYRRVKKLTGKTPGELIRTMRLEKAAILLEKSSLTVSEIVDEIGYLDTKNFRRNFKEFSQMNPMEYRQKKNE